MSSGKKAVSNADTPDQKGPGVASPQAVAALEKAAATIANYFGKPAGADSVDTDSKDAKAPSTACVTKPKADLKASRVRGMARMAKLDIVLPVNYGTVNSSAYVTNSVTALDPSDSVEWTDLQALYDEYRVKKVVLQFQRNAGGFVTPSPASDSMFVLAYDTTDNTPLSGVRNGCEASNHKLFASAVAVNGADIPTYEGAKPHTYTVVMPSKGPLVVSASNLVVSYPGAWKAIGSNPAPDPDGFLKVYWQNNLNNTTAATISGILYYHVEFRRRK